MTQNHLLSKRRNNMKQLIENAILDAINRQSKLTTEAMDIGGFTSPEIRHLMNNLGAISKNYLEIGTHRGALSVAATYKNDIRATLVDNWSEFNESDARENFMHNAQLFMPLATVLEQDCFTMDKMQVPDNVDLYLYDAAHDRESQAKALTYFHDFVAKEFIYCVDDFSWDEVRRGTEQGLAICGYEILAHWDLLENKWWNGFGVYLLRK